MVSLSKRIQIVMVEPDQYAQIAAAFANVDMKYSKRAEELDLPAVMEGVTWQQYEALLDALPDRYLRQAYYRGTLELREKRMLQQRTKCVIGRFITVAAFEFGKRIDSIGSAHLTRKKLRCGIEPDYSYFIANEELVRHLWDVDAEHLPVPDLVVETDMDHAYLDRLIVLAALGVPEVWKYDGENIFFHRLNDANKYETVEASLSYPFLCPDDIRRFVDQLFELDDTTLTKAFLKHARRRYKKWQTN